MGSGQSREETECILEFTKRADIATSAREKPDAKLNGIIRQGSASALEQPLPSVQSEAAGIDLYSSLQPGELERFKSMLEDEENDSLLDHLTPQKNTVLHIAARFGFNELVEPILTRRPNLLNEPNSNDELPLHFAAAARYSEVIDTLVKFTKDDDDDDESLSRAMFKKQNKDGDTPLHVAMRNNQKRAALLLITEYREASYIPNKEEKSPLYMAAEAGDLKLVKIMLDCTPTNLPNTLSKHKSVVHAAITGKNLGVLKEILSKEPSLINSTASLMGKPTVYVYPLSYAAYVGNTYMVEYMVKCFPRCVSKMDESGTFPIHLAAEAGHKKVIEEFLRLQPESRELCTLNGENILHVAAKSGQNHVVKYLLGKSGFNDHMNINAKDNKGNTPLHLATQNNYPKVVDTLTCNKRVMLDAVNNEGMTPMDVAMSQKSRGHTFKERLTWLALRYAGAPRRKQPLARSGTLSDSSIMKSFKKQSSTLLVVATLVTTMSFTAGLQMPGGNGHGNSFLRRPMFQMFLITNSMAFYASILSMLILFFALLDDVNLIQVSLRYGEPLLAISLILVSIAFMAAAYLVGSTIKWLAFAVWILCSAFLAAFIPLFVLLFPRVSVTPGSPLVRFIVGIPFRAMVYFYTFLAGE